jgi:hypothetical protein
MAVGGAAGTEGPAWQQALSAFADEPQWRMTPWQQACWGEGTRHAMAGIAVHRTTIANSQNALFLHMVIP